MFAKRYIAGPTLEEAIDAIKKFNARGIVATLDILGEEVEKKEDSVKVVEEYKHALSEIESNNLDANISVKPTHLGLKIDKEFCYLGLKIDKEFCYQNIRTLVIEAKKCNNFVRIDMEDYTCTTDTIDIYSKLHKEFDNVGVVIQTYMRRTIEDVNQLSREKANLRLCKGIYVEPTQIAYKDANIINSNFQYTLRKLLKLHTKMPI
jgi:proline dehydrogenase